MNARTACTVIGVEGTLSWLPANSRWLNLRPSRFVRGMKLKAHAILSGALLPILLLSSGAAFAQVPIPDRDVQPEVRVTSAESSAMVLRRRLPSGAPKADSLSVAVGLWIGDGRVRWRTAVPAGASASSASPLRSYALILWDVDSPASPPSVLYLHVATDGATSLGGRLFLSTNRGGPRSLSHPGLWQSLGVGGQILVNSRGPEAEFSIPLALMQELFPSGVLADVRILLRDGALYSYGPVGSWFEPPDETRATRVIWPATATVVVGYGAQLKSIAAANGALPVAAGVQLWALSTNPLPLDPSPVESRSALASADQLRDRGDKDAAIAVFKQVVESTSPIDLAWQEAMLQLQSRHLDDGELPEALDVGLRTIEAEGIEEGVAITAFRTLAVTFLKAGIELSATDPSTAALKSRFLLAVADGSYRAAFGADLLILQGQLRDAVLLLESVRDNPYASRPVRANALYRLAQLNAQSGNWREALELVERIQVEVPIDIRLRGAALALLSDGLAAGSADSGDLRSSAAKLHANLETDMRRASARYFSGVLGAAGSDSVSVPKED